ncbi:MAG TPA: NADH-quinone oxidoreductase subunit C [Candidatus Limnocylindrales bacterium]|nr:NADH-quinone oxidoreductase subunit C [Candidatus Limnocylindrales bacterium]
MGLRPDPELLEALDSDQTMVVEKLRARFGAAVLETQSFRKQLSIWLQADETLEALRFAKSDPHLLCELLTDLTAVDYLEQRAPNEPRFEVVYNLYSITFNRRFFLKVGVAEDKSLPSATSLWRTANYLEREVFDLFGIRFDGHPNLERILTPDGWLGHPLRKDFPTQSDQFPNVEA